MVRADQWFVLWTGGNFGLAWDRRLQDLRLHRSDCHCDRRLGGVDHRHSRQLILV
jgi:hypothetical protein